MLNAFRSLRSFGLNPSDWQIDRSYSATDGEVAFRHRRDTDFCLHGELGRGPKTVGELYAIRVISI